MRKLKTNEKFIKEYDTYILIEVACPHGQSYKTTIDKWTYKDKAKVEKENTCNYKYLGFRKGGIFK